MDGCQFLRVDVGREARHSSRERGRWRQMGSRKVMYVRERLSITRKKEKGTANSAGRRKIEITVLQVLFRLVDKYIPEICPLSPATLRVKRR